jgi:hypothetical protein
MIVLDGPVAKFSFELEIQAARHHGTWVKNSFLRNKKTNAWTETLHEYA